MLGPETPMGKMRTMGMLVQKTGILMLGPETPMGKMRTMRIQQVQGMRNWRCRILA